MYRCVRDEKVSKNVSGKLNGKKTTLQQYTKVKDDIKTKLK